MKLTWFGNATFRIHTGGAIVVVAPETALEGIEPAELLSGADRIVGFADGDDFADAEHWKPRAPLRPLEAEEQNRAPQIVALDADSLVIDADGEAPILVARGAAPPLGRWAEQGVIVLAGQELAARADAILARLSPRLIALAGDEAEIDAAFVALRDKLDGTGLVALERALAVEV